MEWIAEIGGLKDTLWEGGYSFLEMLQCTVVLHSLNNMDEIRECRKHSLKLKLQNRILK